MSRLLAILVLSSSLITANADAQSRRPVRRGDVTGVELSLEGSTSVVRGGTVRWLVSAYEVVGLDQLRPAPGAQIVIATALDERESVTVDTNSAGQALLEIPVPEDAPGGFGVTLTVNASRGVTRRFDLQVATSEYRVLELFAPPAMHSGTTLPLAGRLSRTGGAALGGQEITLTLRDSLGPLGAPVVVRTDDNGVFERALSVPRRAEGGVQVVAQSVADEDRRRVSASASVALLSEPTLSLMLQARPLEPIVRPGGPARFEIIARRPDGRPVQGAIVSFNDMPVVSRIMEIPEQREDRYAVTDARGRAILDLDPIRTRGVRGSYQDLAIAIHAGAEGVGQGSVTTSVRVTEHGQASTLRIEGGALAPGLTVGLHALVARIDGSPASGQRVRIEGPAIGEQNAATNELGAARFDVRYDPSKNDGSCGGSAATKVRLTAPDALPYELCVAVDVDQTTRPLIQAIGAESVTVQVQRRNDVSRAPVLVTLHRLGANGSEPIAAIRVQPNQDTAELSLADGPRGDFVVRTRALMGREERPVRGALVRLMQTPDPVIRPTGQGDTRGIGVELNHVGARTTLLTALPIEISPDLRANTQHEAFLYPMQIGIVERDDAAPYVLRGGRIVPAPVPANSGALLRDPWRASERFVSGRLGLVFRALEARVEQAVPGRIQDVATESNGRMRLNDELIASLDAGTLGGEGATGLGGEALTIEQLTQIDRNFGYDAIGKRITRQRLFGLLLALRDFVRERGFDLPWARPGDPTLWLQPLLGRHVAGFGSVTARSLADGWGRPFRLQRVTNPRYTQVQPVAGFELVSAGPDGRYGTGDDLRDPTARVLASGSLYGNAVGEDDLVARLGGVELGRASAQALAGAFGVGAQGVPASQSAQGNVSGLPVLPTVLPDRTHALALQRPAARFSVPYAFVRGSGAQTARLTTGEEPRTWTITAFSFGPAGERSVDQKVVRAGSSVLTTSELPRRLLMGEPFISQVQLTNVGRDNASFTIDASGSSLRVDAPASLEVPAGETRQFDATLSASEPGEALVSLVVAHGEDSRRVTRRLNVGRGLHPIRRVATGIAPFRTTLRVPGEAVAPQTRIVAIGGSGLGLDPDLEDVRRAEPALIAWSQTLAGAALTPDLRAELLRSQNRGPLAHAPAVIALSALFKDDGQPDEEAAVQRAALVSQLMSIPALPDRDAAAGRLRSLALSVTALATSGVPDGAESDPVSAAIAMWRRDLRRALRDVPAESTLLGRASAALLLVDPRDGHARAMYARAIEDVRREGGFSTLVGTEDRPGRIEELSGTLGLAIAAHQLGDYELSRALVRGAAQHVSTITRAPSEATFWWLAAGAYGLLGETPDSVDVSVGGQTRSIALSGGIGMESLDTGSGQSVRVLHTGADHVVLLRVESVFGRPFATADGSLLAIRLQGESGRVGGQAGFELELTASGAVSQPVVELQLPAGVEATDELLNQFSRSGAVANATRRNPGFIRLELVPMAAESTLTIALPVPWISPSSVLGLGAVAYPAGLPQTMTVMAPTRVTPQPRGSAATR